MFDAVGPAADTLLATAWQYFWEDASGFWPAEDGAPYLELLQHLLCERTMINEFLRFADELGLDVPSPGDETAADDAFLRAMSAAGQDLRAGVEERGDDIDESYLQMQVVKNFTESLLDQVTTLSSRGNGHALAQHHGIRTRLLDWTRDPVVATFFAADASVEADAFAVFALQASSTNFFLDVVSVPRASSAFVHAQSGVFTVYQRGAGEREFLNEGEWPSLEQLHDLHLEDERIRLDGGDEVDPVRMRKIIVPSTFTSEVAETLLREGVSRAHLMPTLDNVAEVVNARWASLLGS